MRLRILLAASLLSPIFSSAQISLTDSIRVGGASRTYRLYIPASYSAGTPAPMVFNLHGLGSNALQQEFYANFGPIADTAGFIVVTPDGRDTAVQGFTGKYWDVGFLGGNGTGPNADVDFLSALIDTVAADYNVDRTRVYSAGMSNGGYMSYFLAWRLPTKIAAVASVTGAITPGVYTAFAPGRAVPVMQIHGTADGTVPYTGSANNIHIDTLVAFWVRNNGCNPTPAFTAVPNTNPNDGSTAERYVWSGGSAPVEFFKVLGGGHTWPGAFPVGPTNQDFSASREIWRFFRGARLSMNVGRIEPKAAPVLRFVPNPAAQTVRVEGGVPAGLFRVLDAAGRTVSAGRGQSVSLEGLPGGSYTVAYTFPDGKVSTGKVVKE